MTNPQQPELHRSGYGDTTQEGQEISTRPHDTPETGGDAAPTPPANQDEASRRSGDKSTVRGALED